MKKLNKKGFTLIELLAVIVIMAILMIVAIPAVARTIENTKRDTFANNAKLYVTSLQNAIAANEVYDGNTSLSDAATGYYCYGFDSSTASGQDLVEQGGKSSWDNKEVKGYIVVKKTFTAATATAPARSSYEYAIRMADPNGHGIASVTAVNSLKRTAVVGTGATQATAPKDGGSTPDNWGSVKLSSTSGSGLTVCKPLTIQ